MAGSWLHPCVVRLRGRSLIDTLLDLLHPHTRGKSVPVAAGLKPGRTKARQVPPLGSDL